MAQQEKNRYSDAELAEFKELILKKLEQNDNKRLGRCLQI